MPVYESGRAFAEAQDRLDTLAPQPLYIRYVDVYELVQILKNIMDTGAHLKYENKAGTVA